MLAGMVRPKKEGGRHEGAPVLLKQQVIQWNGDGVDQHQVRGEGVCKLVTNYLYL